MPSYPPRRWAAHLRALAEPLAGADPPPLGDGPDGEVWRAAEDGSIEVDRLLSPSGGGALWPQDPARRPVPIEVWTERELSGLHALWWVAQRRRRADLHRRVAAARDFHLRQTQPDNATNRPWALHVFLLAGSDEGRLYAETLLHNCLVATGRPDPLSAWILVNAARALEAEDA